MLFQQLFLTFFNFHLGTARATIYWKDGIVPYLIDGQFDPLMVKKIKRAILSGIK